MKSYRRALAWPLVLATGLAGAALPAVAAAADDGAINVTVVRDYDSDGTYKKDWEPGVAGIPVKLYDDSGEVAEAVTDEAGKVTFPPGTSGKYRVEAAIPDSLPYLRPAVAYGTAPALAPLVSFVDVSNGQPADVVMGVHNPVDYVQADPSLATPTHAYANVANAVPGTRAIGSWPWSQRGDAMNKVTSIAEYGKVGSTYGLAWHRSTRTLFAGAMARRHTSYGPLGQGGIYAIAEDGSVKEFATVPDAGSTPHDVKDPLNDTSFWRVPGTESLGDLDLSADEKTLYAVNLNNRSLVAYDVATAELTGTWAIPDQGCPSADDWRPFGLAVHEGKVYVGGVCSGQSTQQRTDMSVHILSADTAAGAFTPVYKHTLDFKRGKVNYAYGPEYWTPWLADDVAAPSHWKTAPLLSDIEFDRDGSMILGFRDRLQDQLVGQSGGDINRVCRIDGSWYWEGEGDCANNAVTAKVGHQGKDVVEYYTGDYYIGGHAEVAQGALAFKPRFADVAGTVMDPGGYFRGGVGFFDNKTGQYDTVREKYQLLFAGGFSKSNGLGDLEVLADPAPIQVGDRVWYDTDNDGTQDPAEPGLAGVKAQLTCGDSTQDTVTGDGGWYAFNNVPPATKCTIAFDPSGATGLPEGVTDLKPTKQGTGGTTDSDLGADGITFTTGQPGDNDHTLDAGYTATTAAATVSVGDHVWFDTDKDGVQDDGEPGIPGVTVTLACTGLDTMTTTTDSAGKYAFTGLPASTECELTFDPATATELPDGVTAAGLVTTTTGAGDPATDSNPDTSGKVTITTPATGDDPTYDAGYTVRTDPEPSQPPVDPKPTDPAPTQPPVDPKPTEPAPTQPPTKPVCNRGPLPPTPERPVIAGPVGRELDTKLRSSCGAITYTVTNGDLPEGVTISADGKVTGTPTVIGNYAVTVQACKTGTDTCTTSTIYLDIYCTKCSQTRMTTTRE